MIVIPIFPEMLAAVEEKFPELAGEELNNVAAGYFNSFLGVGEAVGPISASLLTMQFGFRSSEDGIAIMILVYCVVFFALCGGTSMLKCITEQDKIDKELNDDNFKQVFESKTEHAPQTVPLRSGSIIGDLFVEKFVEARLSATRNSRGSRGLDSSLLNRSRKSGEK